MTVYSRRSFLARSVAATIGVGVHLSHPGRAMGGWFGWWKKTDVTGESLAVGPLSGFAEGKWTSVQIGKIAPSGKDVTGLKILVWRQGPKAYAMSSRCTHRGCRVEVRTDGTFRCPCHGAQFDSAGRVTRGPATEPLTWYATRITDSGVVVVETASEIEPPSGLSAK